MATIKDEFGKKIGGSKRDEWKTRGLTVADLEEMNEAEKIAYIKKDNVWPKIDCESMKEKGIPVEIIFFTKMVRDSISKTPIIGNHVLYIETIEILKEMVSELTIPEDIDGFFKKCEAKGFVSHVHGRSYSMSDALKEVGGAKVFRAIASSLKNCQIDIKKKKFLYSDEDIILSDYVFIPVYNTKELFKLSSPMMKPEESTYCMMKVPNGYIGIHNLPYLDAQAIVPGSCLVIKGYNSAGVYASEEEAKADILKKNLGQVVTTKKKAAPRKKKFLYEQLDILTQSNATNYLAVSKTGDDYISDFKFYGGEFGTWLSDTDRQKNLDMAYVSFVNLATALNVSLDQISMGERLSIAFGARGRGNAMAHYEPLRKVINLTKWKGAGSLAHEYGHAIDFIVGEVFNLKSSCMELPRHIRNAYTSIRDLYDAMFWSNGKRSDFYTNSLSFDANFSKDGGYWASATEMFARAFACYIKDKLSAKGIRDDYLCGHAETCKTEINGKIVKAYPEGDERKRINKAFDNFLAVTFKF